MRKFNVTVNGVVYEVDVEEVAGSAARASAPAPAVAPKTATAPAAKANVAGTQVKSPMPGTIVNILANEGQAVKKGDVLCLLEAMKMENEIFAPCDGKVVSVNVHKGDSVANEQVLFVIG